MIIEKDKREINLPVLAYTDHTNVDGTKTRTWFKLNVTFRIIDEEKYSGMTLTLMKSFYKNVTLVSQKNVRVFLSQTSDAMRGACVQEICSNDEIEGLVIKVGSKTPIGEDEVKELLATGNYQVRTITGNKLELPPVHEE